MEEAEEEEGEKKRAEETERKMLALRLDSEYEQWWFVAPIDWAAANGQADIVRVLLAMDPSLFRNLTSKRRLRRLEKLWDDPAAFSAVASGRARIVKDLILRDSYRPLASSAHWAVFVAASAGDASLLHRLLHIDSALPCLPCGDGEFGISDFLYAAARGGNLSIFRTLLHLGAEASPPADPSAFNNAAAHGSTESSPPPTDPAARPVLEVVGHGFEYYVRAIAAAAEEGRRREVLTKALLAAARAGSVEAVEEVLLKGMGGGAEEMLLCYRDSKGAAALHAAAGRGQLKVVRRILELCPESVTVQDAKHNTALHTAARRGCVQVAVELIQFHTDLIYLKNSNGETPLHSAVKGTKQAPPRSIMKQGGKAAMVRQILAFNDGRVADYVNWKTDQGQTALHLAVAAAEIDDNLVALLLESPGIRVEVVDEERRTAIDTAKMCKEANPVAEYRCNIAISLLQGAMRRAAAQHSDARPSTFIAISPERELAKSESVGSTTVVAAVNDEHVDPSLTFVSIPCSDESDYAASDDGSPYPTTQCFSVLHSLFLPGRKLCRAGIWSCSSKKWNPYPVSHSPTQLQQDVPRRHRFIANPHAHHEVTLSPVSASFVPTPTAITSPTHAMSPSLLKSGLKALNSALLPPKATKRKSSKAFSSRNTSESDLQELVSRGLDLDDHLDPLCQMPSFTDSNEQEDNGAAVDSSAAVATTHHLDHQFSDGRRSAQACNQCFCLDFLQVRSHRRCRAAAETPTRMSTPANSDDSREETEEDSHERQSPSKTDSNECAAQSSGLRHARSSSGSSQNSTARPSASLSLSPWLSPTLRAARKQQQNMVASQNAAGRDERGRRKSAGMGSTGHGRDGHHHHHVRAEGGLSSPPSRQQQ